MVMEQEFEIHIPHFYCLEYTEGSRKMKVDIDFRDTILYLCSDLIDHWESPHEKERITVEDRLRIARNIYEYLLAYMGPNRVQWEEK